MTLTQEINQITDNISKPLQLVKNETRWYNKLIKNYDFSDKNIQVVLDTMLEQKIKDLKNQYQHTASEKRKQAELDLEELVNDYFHHKTDKHRLYSMAEILAINNAMKHAVFPNKDLDLAMHYLKSRIDKQFVITANDWKHMYNLLHERVDKLLLNDKTIEYFEDKEKYSSCIMWRFIDPIPAYILKSSGKTYTYVKNNMQEYLSKRYNLSAKMLYEFEQSNFSVDFIEKFGNHLTENQKTDFLHAYQRLQTHIETLKEIEKESEKLLDNLDIARQDLKIRLDDVIVANHVNQLAAKWHTKLRIYDIKLEDSAAEYDQLASQAINVQYVCQEIASHIQNQLQAQNELSTI